MGEAVGVVLSSVGAPAEGSDEGYSTKALEETGGLGERSRFRDSLAMLTDLLLDLAAASKFADRGSLHARLATRKSSESHRVVTDKLLFPLLLHGMKGVG